MSNNNPLAEIGLLVLSVAILAAMTVLLVIGKINYIEALNFLIVVAGIFGINVAAKAPSPAQQQQLSDQQASLQQLIAQLTNTILPAVFQAHTHPSTQVQNSLQTLANIGGNPSPDSTPVQLAPGALATTTTVQPQVQFMPPYTPPDPKSMMAWSTQAEIPAIATADRATQSVPVPPTP